LYHFHGAGKTTLLRDIVRNISNGNDFVDGLTVGLVDERGEISAMYKGEAQNDVGCRTDVLSNIPKAIGMKMLIRSMDPQVLVADEIGNNDDIIAIREAMCSRNKGYIHSTWSKL
jgi:stage III sporulation protein AA